MIPRENDFEVGAMTAWYDSRVGGPGTATEDFLVSAILEFRAEHGAWPAKLALSVDGLTQMVGWVKPERKIVSGEAAETTECGMWWQVLGHRLEVQLRHDLPDYSVRLEGQ